VNLDLALLVLVAVFAFAGAYSGAARQVAQLVALVVAYLCARPLGTLVAPKLAAALNAPLMVGAVAGTLLVFIAVMVLVRWALTRVLRRILAGKNPENRGLDRFLGFCFGAIKVAAIAYVIVCALTFVEQNVTVAGKKVGLSPKDSLVFAVARRFNLFEMTQFAAVNDLVKVARAAADPRQSDKVKASPAYKSLRTDPRFNQAMGQEAMRQAIETGDYRALLRSNAILQLIQDPAAAERLSQAAEATSR
jgi:membrane protein required for colicin V production